MATAQLSIWGNTFCGVDFRAICSPNLTFGSSHSTSPAYQIWSTKKQYIGQLPNLNPRPSAIKTCQPPPGSQLDTGFNAYIQSLRISRGRFAPVTPNHDLYLPLLSSAFCYPEGNFGGNQLLNGSIGLSPLYSSLTNDLHVSTVAVLHQGFPWLRPAQA